MNSEVSASRKEPIPCLLVAFVRTEGTLRTLRQLLENGFRKIYVSIDGPRNQSDKDLQKVLFHEIADLITSSGIKINVKLADENLGLSAAVLRGIDWFFENEDQGIILEDDLIIHEDFFRFAEKSLMAIESMNAPSMFSGNQFFASKLENTERRVSTYPLIWGWGTTKKSWLEFRKAFDPHVPISLKGSSLRSRNFLRYGRNRALQGRVNSWAIPLAAYFHENKFKCWLPPENLVMNVGGDDYSTHTNAEFGFLNIPLSGLPPLMGYFDEGVNGSTKHLDKLIESHLYQIRFRHIFLPVYDPLLRLFQSVKMKYR